MERLFGVVVFGIAIAFLTGAHCDNTPTAPPVPDCPADVGTMVVAPGLEFSVYPCFACTGATRCFTEGAQYCCEGWMCDECGARPVISRARRDGGVR